MRPGPGGAPQQGSDPTPAEGEAARAGKGLDMSPRNAELERVLAVIADHGFALVALHEWPPRATSQVGIFDVACFDWHADPVVFETIDACRGRPVHRSRLRDAAATG